MFVDFINFFKQTSLSCMVTITILYSSQWEIKAVIRSHNEEHFSVILSHEAHTHIHTLRHTPTCSQSAYSNSKPKMTWNNAFSVKTPVKTLKLNKIC